MSLCLNMIVKDEARIIERCLSSVLPWVSCFAILDTGSTDGTLDLITKAFAASKIPGEIHQGPFENFRSARERALGLGRKVAADNDATHLLLLDADMRLVVDEPDEWKRLAGPEKSFAIEQRMGDIRYANVRVVRVDSNASYFWQGSTRTHEACIGDGIYVSEDNTLRGIWFQDFSDGSSHANNHRLKHERDVMMLRQDLEENPNNERAMFYLAESYRNLGNLDEAIRWHQKRETAGGFQEEAWYAGLMQVRCLIAQKKLDEALSKALLVFEKDPKRAEPLVEMSRALREMGRNELSSLLAFRALDIGMPRSGLFLEEPTHRWGARQEMSIAGFYSAARRVKNAGREACFSLSVDPDVPAHVRELARSNCRHWARPLQTMVSGASGPKMLPHFSEVGYVYSPPEHWNEKTMPFWRCMNPSVFNLGNNGIGIALRHVNYSIDDGGHYIMRSEDGHVRTRTAIGKLDPLTHEVRDVLWAVETEEVIKGRTANGSKIHGFEDLRPFIVPEKPGIFALATTLEHTPDVRAQVALLQLIWCKDSYEIANVWLQPREGHQKNWLPVVGVAARCLFSTSPTVVQRMDEGGSYVSESTHATGRLELSSLRGGSHVLPCGNGESLYVAHEAIDTGGMRAYVHRFVLLDEEMKVKSVSDPFNFGSGQSIEFCAGMAFWKGDAILSYGARDAAGFVMRVPKSECVRIARKWEA